MPGSNGFVDSDENDDANCATLQPEQSGTWRPSVEWGKWQDLNLYYLS
jgi:hypothetical protein